MKILVEKYINQQKIDQVKTGLNFNKETYEEFIRFIAEIIQREIELNHFVPGTEKSYETEVVEFATDYIKEFIKQQSKGFSFAWAQAYGFNDFFEKDDKSLVVAYEAVRKIDPEQAIKDLETYAALNDKDNLFVKHFVFLASIDSIYAYSSIEESIAKFTIYYKAQIANGKGEVFALKYADLSLINEFDELSFQIEATEYEKAILAGYSKDYANAYAMELAKSLSMIFGSYEEVLNHKLTQIKMAEIGKKYEHLK
jgi:hypothetical protein